MTNAVFLFFFFSPSLITSSLIIIVIIQPNDTHAFTHIIKSSAQKDLTRCKIQIPVFLIFSLLEEDINSSFLCVKIVNLFHLLRQISCHDSFWFSPPSYLMKIWYVFEFFLIGRFIVRLQSMYNIYMLNNYIIYRIINSRKEIWWPSSMIQWKKIKSGIEIK